MVDILNPLTGDYDIDERSIRGDIERAFIEIGNLTSRLESMSSNEMAQASRRFAMMVSPISEGDWESTTTHSDIYNVKDFGAVGDGSVDDTSAIQSTITRAEADEKNVLIPAGVYLVSAPIFIDPGGSSKQPLSIDGSWATLQATGANFASILDVNKAEPFSLRRLHLDCREIADCGLVAYKINNMESCVESIKVSDARVSGIDLRACQITSFRNIQVRGSGVQRYCNISGTTLTLVDPANEGDTSSMSVGCLLDGIGSPAGLKVDSIDATANTFEMSAPWTNFGTEDRECTVLTDTLEVTDRKGLEDLNVGDGISGENIASGTKIDSLDSTVSPPTITMTKDSLTSGVGLEITFALATGLDLLVHFNGFEINRKCTINGTGVEITDLSNGKNTDALSVGDTISGSGIPSGTTIASIEDDSKFTMSASGTSDTEVDVSFSHKADGWMVRGCNATTFDSCSAKRCSGNGFTIMGYDDNPGLYSGGCSWFNTHSEDNARHGIEIKEAGGVFDDSVCMSGGWVESNTKDAFSINLPTCTIQDFRIIGGGLPLTASFRIHKTRSVDSEESPPHMADNWGITIRGNRISSVGIRDYDRVHIVGGEEWTGCKTIEENSWIELPSGKSALQGGNAEQDLNWEKWKDVEVFGTDVERRGIGETSYWRNHHTYRGDAPRSIIQPSDQIPGNKIGSGAYWEAPEVYKKIVDWSARIERTCTFVEGSSTITLTGGPVGGFAVRTCNIESDSNLLVISGGSITTNIDLAIGDVIVHASIPVGTTIQQLGPGAEPYEPGVNIIMSANATGDATGVTVNFTEKVAFIVPNDFLDEPGYIPDDGDIVAVVASIDSSTQTFTMKDLATGDTLLAEQGGTQDVKISIPWRLFVQMTGVGSTSNYEASSSSVNATVKIMGVRRHWVEGNYRLYNPSGDLSPVIVDS